MYLHFTWTEGGFVKSSSTRDEFQDIVVADAGIRGASK